MSIEIVKAGVGATLQDAGRFGYRNLGIGSGGPMDFFALQMANYLCGNKEGAVIEINFPAPVIRFEQAAIISITGADFGAAIDGKALAIWKPVFVKQHALLTFNKPLWGNVAYLAVSGGWQASKWLNSSATHLKLAVGGHLGRYLQKGDVLQFAHSTFFGDMAYNLPGQISFYERNKIYEPAQIIRCMKGVEFDGLEAASKILLETNAFTIDASSDRMGARLLGKPIRLEKHIDLLSSAVDMGTIQLLPDGSLIVLLADYPTTGGYPRILSVIKADLPKLAQLKKGMPFSFTFASVAEAEDGLMQLLKTMDQLDMAFKLHYKLGYKQ